MNYRKDDGSTWGGIVTAALCVICFCAGYTLRDRGFSIRVQSTEIRK